MMKKSTMIILSAAVLAGMTACKENADTAVSESTASETALAVSEESRTVSESESETKSEETEGNADDDTAKKFAELCDEYRKTVDEHNKIVNPLPADFDSYEDYLTEYNSYESSFNSCLAARRECYKLLEEYPELSGNAQSDFRAINIKSPKLYRPAETAKTKGEYFSYNDEISFDLNSDGEKEKITYTADCEDYYNLATLTVNDAQYEMWGSIESLLICDIDPEDKYFEIGISTLGASQDYATDFLRYDNGELYSIGSVEDTVDGYAEYAAYISDVSGESLKINGDGTVTASKRLHLFQTWFAYTTYRLNPETGMLEEIKGIYYPYGEELKDDYNAVSSKIYIQNRTPSFTSKTVNLYSEMDRSSEPVVFEAQNFAATATDEKNWVYLVGESGAKGWLYYEDNCIYNENGEVIYFDEDGNQIRYDNAFIDAVTGERYGSYSEDVFCSRIYYD
ncbi:MAG: hypothetical protein J6L05_04625 [Ruminococcus sp.]|nr:hypothetical protein [Ruminococcus sp.]